jgi:hypothetical protein
MEEVLNFIKTATIAEINALMNAAAVRSYLLTIDFPQDWKAELQLISDKDPSIWMGYDSSSLQKLQWKLRDGRIIEVNDMYFGGKHWSAFKCTIKINGSAVIELENDERGKQHYRKSGSKLSDIFAAVRGRALTPDDYDEFVKTLTILGLKDVEQRYSTIIEREEMEWNEDEDEE